MKPLFSISTGQLLVFITLLAIFRGIVFLRTRKNKKSEKACESEKLKVVNEYVDSIIIAGITALVLIQFVIRPFYIPTGSMVPTLKPWDYILVNEFVYRFVEPKVGDIIVFHPPEETGDRDKDYIKRVVAVEGDKILVENGVLQRNGSEISESYISEPMDYNLEEKNIPKDSLFVMGDNRNDSKDSHVWGFLPRKDVVGKAMIIIWPPNRIRLIR